MTQLVTTKPVLSFILQLMTSNNQMVCTAAIYTLNSVAQTAFVVMFDIPLALDFLEMMLDNKIFAHIHSFVFARITSTREQVLALL